MPISNPYNVNNSPTNPPKLTPLLYTDVFTGAFSTTAIYGWLNEGNINLVSSQAIATKGVGFTFPYNRVAGFIHTAYTAGVLGIWTVDFTTVSVVIGAQYSVIMNSGNGALAGSGLGVGTNVVFSTQTATTTSLAAAYLQALSGLIAGGYLTATVLGSVVTVTEASTVTNGFSFYPSDANVVVTNTTADVQPSGTPAQVSAYKAGVTTGTYDQYTWVVKPDIDQSNGVLGHQYEYVVVFVDETNSASANQFAATAGQFNNTADWLPSSWSQNLMKEWFGYQGNNITF